jgi:hypothetical protein
MSADALEVRIARLEGAFDHVDKRLGTVERKLDVGFAELRAEIRGVETGLRFGIRRRGVGTARGARRASPWRGFGPPLGNGRSAAEDGPSLLGAARHDAGHGRVSGIAGSQA